MKYFPTVVNIETVNRYCDARCPMCTIKFAPEFKNDDEFIGTLVKFFNGINDNYNREIHAQSTTYIVDLPEAFHPIVKGIIMKEDNLVYNPQKVEQVFEPVFKEMGNFK